MFCPNCGKNISDGAEFCGDCGFKINKNNNKKISNNSNKIIKIIPLILIVFVIAIFAFKIITNKSTQTFTISTMNEDEKCVSDFTSAMNEFKNGNLSSLKKYVASENLGSIESLFSSYDKENENTIKLCKVIFNSFDFEIEDVEKKEVGKYILHTKMIVPSSSFIKAVSSEIISNINLNDIGLLFADNETRMTKIMDKIIEGYSEVDINDYGQNSIDYDIEMIKIDNRYKINNFTDFLDNSQFGKLLTNIRSLLSSIN